MSLNLFFSSANCGLSAASDCSTDCPSSRALSTACFWHAGDKPVPTNSPATPGTLNQRAITIIDEVSLLMGAATPARQSAGAARGAIFSSLLPRCRQCGSALYQAT